MNQKLKFIILIIINLFNYCQSQTWEDFPECSIECIYKYQEVYVDQNEKTMRKMDESVEDFISCTSANDHCQLLINLDEEDREGKIHKDYIKEYKSCFEDCKGLIKDETVFNFYTCQQRCFGNYQEYVYSEGASTETWIAVILSLLTIMLIACLIFRYIKQRKQNQYKQKKTQQEQDLERLEQNRQQQQNNNQNLPQDQFQNIQYVQNNQINQQNNEQIPETIDGGIPINQVEIQDQYVIGQDINQNQQYIQEQPQNQVIGYGNQQQLNMYQQQEPQQQHQNIQYNQQNQPIDNTNMEKVKTDQ